MTCNFRVFTPFDNLDYYTKDNHEPKYLTPITFEGTPRVFNVRSETGDKENKHQAIALFKNHITYKLYEPEIVAFLVKGYGIVPAKNLICEGEIDCPSCDLTSKRGTEEISESSTSSISEGSGRPKKLRLR